MRSQTKMSAFGSTISTLLASAILQSAFAIPAFPGPLTEQQPDGSVITLFARGTENFHWRTDASGYPVVRDPSNPELFVYAVYDNSTISMAGGAPSRMVPSSLAVGQVDPSTLGVPPNTPPFGLAQMASPDFIQGNNMISYNTADRIEGLLDTSAPPQPLPEMPAIMPSQPVPEEFVGDFLYAASLANQSTETAGLGVGIGISSAEIDNIGSFIEPQPINPAAPGTAAPGSEPLGMNRRQTTTVNGQVQNLVLMIRFADHREGQPFFRALPTTEQMDALFNKVGGDPVLAPTGSIRDVWFKNTFGRMTVNSVMTGWIDVPQTEIATAAGNSGTNQNLWAVIRSALSIVEQRGLSALTNGKATSMRDFDKNNDGKIDMFTIIHSGYGAEMFQADQFRRVPENRIWSHKWQMSPAWRSSTGVAVDLYNISPGLWSTSGSRIGRIGVIAHEIGHYLGLPDLYGSASSDTGIGSYSLMANAWGFDQSQLYPPHLDPWCKISLGVARVVDITNTPGTFRVPAGARDPTVYRIGLGNVGEYLLIENRQPVDFDARLPQAGLAIYHIDDRASFTGPGFPGQGNWPQNGRHYRVAMKQADNRYDMEQGRNRGDAGDVYFGPTRNQLTPNTAPNTNAYQGGNVRNTNVFITSIAAPGTTMTFRFSRGPPTGNGNVDMDEPGISAIRI